MKKLTLLTAAALACCTWSNTFAQVQILRSAAPHAAPRLVSDQTELLEPDSLSSGAAQGNGAIPNPFDYFSDDLPKIEPQAERGTEQPDLLEGQHSLLEDESALLEQHPGESAGSNQAAEQDPASLPVGRHHRRAPSVVDTIINQAALGNIPHASTTPVYWGGTHHTPNPVAEWLLREECVAGLWANYPQQRAAECAQMWACLAGHSSCGASSCGTVSGPCSVCAGTRVRNRYREQACGSCAPACGDNSAGTCNACGPAAEYLPSSSEHAASGKPGGVYVQNAPYGVPGQLVNQTGARPLAQLPSLSTYR